MDMARQMQTAARALAHSSYSSFRQLRASSNVLIFQPWIGMLDWMMERPKMNFRQGAVRKQSV